VGAEEEEEGQEDEEEEGMEKGREKEGRGAEGEISHWSTAIIF